MNDLERTQSEWNGHLERPEFNPLLLNNLENIVLENEFCVYSQDSSEILPGAGLILPRASRPTVFDLTQEERNATFELLLEVKAYLGRTLEPQGYSVGWNVSPVGGQHIPQAHLHVIPRFADEPYVGRGIGSSNPKTAEHSAPFLTHSSFCPSTFGQAQDLPLHDEPLSYSRTP